MSFAGLQTDPADPDVVWGAANYYPPDENSPCGVAKIDVSSGSMLDYIDLTLYRSAATGVCMPNDLIFDNDGNLYVTDFYGYQVWGIALATDSSVSVINR